MGVGVGGVTHGNLQRVAKLAKEEARSDVGLALGREDDARILVVETVLCEPHESCVLLYQENELGI